MKAASRIVIAAPKSGSGKTLVTLALISALKKRGLKVRGFKCGPDYIDPLFHREVLGIPSKNLDLFFTDEEVTKDIFLEDNDADISIVEGVMGLYDGVGGITEQASTYHLAKALKAPIILVVDARGMSRSVIAQIKGFSCTDMDYAGLVRGVILNRVSPSMCDLLKPEIERATGVKVFGSLADNSDFVLESRHLGLVLPGEIKKLGEMCSMAGQVLECAVDIDGILRLAASSPSLEKGMTLGAVDSLGKYDLTVAVARDSAFCFYYEDNLLLLKKLGARIVEFSPLEDREIPVCADGVIFGGGYPELYLGRLSENSSMLSSVRKRLANGLPSIAECGGFMYLHDSISDKEGKTFTMAGVIDSCCRWTSSLVRFGYVSVSGNFTGASIRGHEFHYFDSDDNGADCIAEKPVGKKRWQCVHADGVHWWGFPHLYWWSNVEFAVDFLKKCQEYKNNGRK